jgi:cell division protein FtsW (lipid II flippase)
VSIQEKVPIRGSLPRSRSLDLAFRLLWFLPPAVVLIAVDRFFVPGLVDWRLRAIHLAAFVAATIASCIRKRRGSALVLPLIYTLTGVGLIVHAFFHRQVDGLSLSVPYLSGVVAGCGVFVVLALVSDFQWIGDIRYMVAAAAILLSLLLAALGSGPRRTGTRINLWGFQPAEVIKLLFAMFLAAWIADHDTELWRLNSIELGWLRFPRIQDLRPVLIAVAALVALFFVEHDLGTALILYLLFIGSFAAASRRFVLAGAGLVILLGVFAATWHWGILATVNTRLDMWIEPWDNRHANGTQLAESLWALSSGAVRGLWNLATPSIVPAGGTDLVLATAGEIFGVAGVSVILATLASLCAILVRISSRAVTPFERWLAWTMALLLGAQTCRFRDCLSHSSATASPQ